MNASGDGQEATRPIRRTTLFDDSSRFDCGADELDIRELRSGFAALGERAAEAVQRAGHDLDEVVFDRFLCCRPPMGGCIEVPVKWLADERRLLADIRARCEAADGELPRIESLRLVAHLEEWPGQSVEKPDR